MLNQYNFGYLKEAVKAHLDFEEDELSLMNISQRFHFFANEAIQYISHEKPKYVYFEFSSVGEFTPLVYDDGAIRVATIEEQNWETYGLPEPTFLDADETASWYNEQNIYLVGQVISMPNNFLAFANKKGYVWTTTLDTKETLGKTHMMYLSDSEIVVYYAANYLVPYQATWMIFSQTDEDKDLLPIPSDLALTIPIYVASVILQQRNLSMASAKRQEFEIAVSRCKSSNFLANKDVTPTFR